jgi:hypothetical protein
LHLRRVAQGGTLRLISGLHGQRNHVRGSAMAGGAIVATQGGSLRAGRPIVVATAAASSTTARNGKPITQRTVRAASGPDGDVMAALPATAEQRKPIAP